MKYSKILKSTLLILSVSIGITFIKGGVSFAFNANNLIDDSSFDNTGTMSAGSINSWLNSNFPNSCISTNHGFSAPDPTGYSPSTGFTYGGPVSAGQVIYDAAVAYGLNPQVLLTTLQKEESLVDGSSGCSALRFSASVGYGCPDGGTTYNYSNLNPAMYYINGSPVNSINGTCVKSAADVGFAQQLIHASWLLKFGEQRSEGNTGWDVQNDNFPESGDHWDNSDDPQTCYGGPMTQGNFKRCSSDTSTTYFDGYTVIDGTSTHMDTGATAALYWYTPHFSGNQSFDNIFFQWFPSYLWDSTQFTIQDKTGTTSVDPGKLLPGQEYLVTMQARNIGTATWYNNGPNPVTLAPDNPEGHSSFLCDPTWLSCNRASYLQEASVAPGATGHFQFYIGAPFTPGYYREYFRPVAEFLSWFNAGTDSLGIRVISPGTFTDSTTGYMLKDQSNQQVDPGRLQPGQLYTATATTVNTGTATWSNSGPTPVLLAASNPTSRTSSLCYDSWEACNRPAYLTESSVAPGQTGHFTFTFRAPYITGSYRESFKPVAERFAWFNDNPPNDVLGIIVVSSGTFNWTTTGYIIKDQSNQQVDPGNLTHGQTYTATLMATNTGTATWANTGPTPVTLATTNSQSHNSFLCDPSWLACNRPAYLTELSVAPGQTGHFTFTFQAPSTTGAYREYFKPVAEFLAWFNEYPSGESLGIWVTH